MRSVEVLVIGGGASGMMAASVAAAQGAKVLLLEKNDKLGKKIYATGNGRCNYTNAVMNEECFYCERESFPMEVISKFDQQAVLDWFFDKGILPYQRNGYYYPMSNQAGSIVRVLERELKSQNVEIHYEEICERISRQEKTPGMFDGFLIKTTKDRYFAKTLILACGGKASPAHGSTGDGYRFAQEFGLDIRKPLPALTSVVLNEKFTKDWTGIRIQGQIMLCDDTGNCLQQDQGEIQCVAYGISGIPVFQISRCVARCLDEKRKVYLQLDSMPDLDQEELFKELKRRRERFLDSALIDLLEGMLPSKLCRVMVREIGQDNSLPMKKVTDDILISLCVQIKRKKLRISSVSDFEKAQVTTGGVMTEQLKSVSLEASQYPGLYLVGELVDVDGICGGYNLQWAWSSGYLAGKDAGKLAVLWRQQRKEKRNRP